MKRLGLLAAVLVWAFAPTAQAQTSVLVINSGAASLSVMDLQSRTEIAHIPVLREPHHWALSPDGKDLLIGDSAANEVLFLDPTTFALKRRLTIADPYQMGFSPDGKYLVVTGLARGQVDVYDSYSYALVHRFKLKSMPSHVDFTPDSSTAFISLQGSGRACAIDLRNMTVLWNEVVGPAPAGVMYLNGKLLVADMGADGFEVVDPANGHVERKITTAPGAHQLFLSPDRKILYVNNRIAPSQIVALDAVTLKEIRRYQVPGGPDDMVFTPDGHIVVTLRFVAKVGILDPKTGVLETFPVGRSPHGIYIKGAINSGGGNKP
jgi:DNA-binding beta-propeller fold protein YncE